MTALMKAPYRNLLLLIVNVRPEKSGLPKIAAMSGVRMSATKAVTTAPNAAPMTTATARSTTLPRRMKSLEALDHDAPSQRTLPAAASGVPTAAAFGADGTRLRRRRRARDHGRVAARLVLAPRRRPG